MARQYGTVEVKRERGELIVRGMATTPRGTKFIAKVEPLGVKTSADPNFKEKLGTAVEKLFA